MPKQKTRKSVAKRVKVTRTGKVLRRSTHIRHLRRRKSRKRVRRLKRIKQVKGRMAKKIKKRLGK